MGQDSRVSGVSRWGSWIAAALCAVIAVVSYRFVPFGVEKTMEIMAHNLADNRVMLYLHIAVAPVVLLLLPVQLSKNLRMERPALHRWAGRFCVFLILLSGTAGLGLAFTTTAGPVAASGFAVLAVIWLGVTGAGLVFALRRDFARHRRWMLRSAALTFAAVTLRIYLGASMAAGLPFEIAYPAIAWLCWLPNAVVVELYLRRPGSRNRARMISA